MGFFVRGSGLVRTRHVHRHARCSVRVLQRVNAYGNIRGCSHIVTEHPGNDIPSALLSCFPSSFILFISRSRIALPRMENVCNKSETQGRGLIRCNFQLPSTFSGQPLGFSRFCDRVGRTIFISTAPKSFRGRGTARVIRRMVHPAKLLSPRVSIHPARNRVSSLVDRVGTHVTGGRHILIAALAGGVTRGLARFLGGTNVGMECVRRSVSAVRHVRVVHNLHLNSFSILINVGLLERKLSVPRISLITVLSTSGRNFLQDRASLIRAVNHTTHGTSNAIVVCTSSIAHSVRGTVHRARHHETVRGRCGVGGNVIPGAVVGSIHSILRVNDGIGSLPIGGLSHTRESTRVGHLATRVHRTTGVLRFRCTTGLESGVGRLGKMGWILTSSGVVVGNTDRRGLGGVGTMVPHSGLMVFANLSKDNGSSLTFSAVCTRKREQCMRSLSSCTHRFLNRVRGPGIRIVRKLSPTVSVSRGAASGGPHSAINAIARVCSCLHLLCTHINMPRYPIYNGRVGRRAASRVISVIVGLSTNDGVRVLSPTMAGHGNRRIGRLRRTHGRNFTEMHVSSLICSLSRRVGLRGGGGRAVRMIISHLIVGSRVRSELASDVRATIGLSNNLIGISMVNKRRLGFSRACTYSRRNVDVPRLAPAVFSFGGPVNTYPRYVNVNIFVGMGPGLLVGSRGGSLLSNTVETSN